MSAPAALVGLYRERVRNGPIVYERVIGISTKHYVRIEC